MKWPPENWRRVYEKYAEWAAWYSGDPNQIAAVHSAMVYTPTPRGKHWAKDVQEERRTMIHVPIAGDIATVSADLLFSEAPEIRIPEAHEERAGSDAIQAQERLDEIIHANGLHNRLLEAGESGAALGGVFLKVNWDREEFKYPILSIAQADNAVPEFRWGFLTAVTFWKEIEEDGDTVWRLLERHEKGVILTGLYKGTRDTLGVRVPLTYRSDTKNEEDEIRTNIDDIVVRYVPNIRPNNLWRGSALGKSDYAGLEGLMDALDEVFTSWMRDIRLGQGRLIVPEYWLEKRSDGSIGFDVDREVFTTLPGVAPNQDVGITASQFEIRTEQHRQTALDLLDRIISRAGYSPQTFGLKIEGRAESGTALNIRERKSFVTKAKKERYWKPAIEDILRIMLHIDREFLGSRVTVFRPSVAIQDSIQNDLNQTATAVEMLHRAEAASIWTKVRMVHPDWSVEQVEEEVQRIKEERGLTMPNPDEVGIP